MHSVVKWNASHRAHKFMDNAKYPHSLEYFHDFACSEVPIPPRQGYHCAHPHHLFVHHVTLGFLETMGCSPGCKSSICFISVPKQLDGSRWVLRNNDVASVGNGATMPHGRGPHGPLVSPVCWAEFETTPAVL